MTRMLRLAAVALTIPLALGAQNRSRQTTSGDGMTTTYSHEMAPGDRLELSNVNGDIVATAARGRTAEIVVTKTVKRGDGSRVKAIMEVNDGVVRVCTIYTDRRDSCPNGDSDDNDDNHRGSSRNDNGDHNDNSDIEMHYEVRVPDGVKLEASNVNGGIEATDLDASVKLEAVNGNVTFDGATASELTTVNGTIRGTFSRGSWDGKLSVHTVNGKIDLAFPADLNADITGQMVNGSLNNSDFPLTIAGKWGPKTFSGRIGRGGSRIDIDTVNGAITLSRTGSRSTRRGDDRDGGVR